MSQCDVHAVMIWPFSEQQARALFVLLRIEDHDAARAAGAGARKGRLNGLRAAEQLGAERGVERVQPLDVGAGGCLRHRDDVDDAVRAARAIDDRRRRDADLGRDLRAAPRVAGGLAGAEQRHVPERGARDGVEGVDAIVLGRDVDHIAHAVAGHGDRGQVRAAGRRPCRRRESIRSLAERGT